MDSKVGGMKTLWQTLGKFLFLSTARKAQEPKVVCWGSKGEQGNVLVVENSDPGSASLPGAAQLLVETL